MINILLVDDHAIVRDGLKRIISETSGMKVVAEAENGQIALEMVYEDTSINFVILDISMPGKSGLDVLKEIKRHNDELSVLMLSMHAQDQYAIRTLKAGASGYLTKESASTLLVEAIRKIYQGGRFISDEVAELLALSLNEKKVEFPHEQLSDREYQVMILIASGKTIVEISKELVLSDKTISTYRTRILEKMSLKTNSEITHYAFSNKLVTK
ncbi:MAG: response regulator transcription factor [Candidatus Marinimicrobia bacterium]|nr:response regulator transcription factor [Candidatus Neomarinimicrobiota bacterium]